MKAKNHVKGIMIAVFCVFVIALTAVSCTSQSTSDGESTTTDDGNAQTEANDDFSSARKGDFISFGAYEQDGKEQNGPETIKWRVVAKEEDGSILLISNLCLDVMPFDTSGEDVSWENSDIRAWLSTEFYENAFTEEEKRLILETTLDNSDGEEADSSNATTDRVFLLSADEARKYCKLLGYLQAKATTVAKSKSPLFDVVSGIDAAWWLRTGGGREGHIAVAGPEEAIDTYGTYADYERIAVRPAIWIKP